MVKTTLSERSSGLTKTSDHDDYSENTYPGMASWGGTGPRGKCCIDCPHWGDELKYRPKRRVRKTRLGDVGSIPESAHARCGKYRDTMGREGPAIPGHALSCGRFPDGTETK